MCIQDICRGKVALDDVAFIYSGCAPRNEDDIDQIRDNCLASYWKDLLLASNIFHRLRVARKIGWNNSWERNTLHIHWGHWLDLPTTKIEPC